MGVLRVGWLVVVGGCAVAPSSSDLQLIAISPQLVPLHGGDVELSFEGAMPPDHIYVNGVSAILDGSTLHIPASQHGSGPLSIRVGDASLESAGQYAESPDSVALQKCTDAAGACGAQIGVRETLAIPLHPELAHECARTGVIQVSNNGDAPMVLFPELTGSPGFETIFAEPTCPLPLYYDSCELLMCFSSNIPSPHAARLEIPSSSTTGSLDFTATVLPQTPGLDVALWRPFQTRQHEAVRGVTALPGGAVAVWDESPASSFDLVKPNGAPAAHALGAPILAMRADAAAQGIYAIAGHALAHLDNTGVRDAVDVPLANDATALEVASGVAFAIGNTTVASSAGGTIDFSAHGTFTGTTAVDPQGRLYVATTGGLLRIVGGAIDPTFNASIAVTAIAFPLVASGTTLARLDDTGAATALVQTSHAITDIATDASGRMYVITADGQLTRFTADGQLDGVHGFDGARRIACSATGDCAVVGLANGLDKYLIELAP